jgi:succinoglycan biosynthesis protein ExoO
MIAPFSATERNRLDASVIVATHNSGETIIRAVQSALDQSHVELEVVVVDDHSSDGTRERIAKLADPRVHYFLLPVQMGAAYARNFGISRAEGEWIVILDADDAMHSSRLFKMIGSARSAEADCALDQIEAVDEVGRKFEKFVDPFVPGVLDLETYIRGNILFGSAGLGYLKPILRRAFLNELDLRYRPDLKIGEDFALICDVLLGNGRVLLTTGSGYVYTRHRGSSSYRSSSDDIGKMISYDDYLQKHHAVEDCEPLQSAIASHKDALTRLFTHTMLAESFHSRRFNKFISLILSERGAIPFLWSIFRKRFGLFVRLKGSR